MDSQIVAIYCICDDILKGLHHRDNNQCRMSDAESMTVGFYNPTLNLPRDYVDHDPNVVDRVTAIQLVGLEADTAAQLRSYVIETGRLLTARLNVLRWSEAMGYHLHDERHGFLQMPQRITFIEPVEGGIWIGQVDHVAFLEGATPEGFSVRRLASRAPVPRSSIRLPAEAVGETAGRAGVRLRCGWPRTATCWARPAAR